MIEWVDSASSRGWNDIDDNAAHSIVSVYTAGYIVRQDKHSITVTTSITSIGHVMDSLTIPKVAVVSSKRMKWFVDGRKGA